MFDDVVNDVKNVLDQSEDLLQGFHGTAADTRDLLAAASAAAGTLDGLMSQGRTAMGQAIDKLGSLLGGLEDSDSPDYLDTLLDILGGNPEDYGAYFSQMVQTSVEPVYPIDNYGSAMAPYYIMLALFVGSLLTATMIHVNAPIPPLSRLRPWQRFFGRYQLFFLVGMVQALVTGLGCVYYIGMQCLHPGLFLLACCVCSLNFTMMNFALVYALDNIGMALSVIIMVIQVAGSGGSYPIDVLPEVFQKLYVLMPFHYGMDMLRETIAGRYENVYWTNLAVMAGMCVLFAALGMLLYYPARPLNRLIARSKEKSGIM